MDIPRGVIDAAIGALAELRVSLGTELPLAALHLAGCDGRIVFCGLGKSGIAARKMASTFASLGRPSLFLHPADAVHGDLGKMCSGDILVAISVSGETNALLPVITYAQARGIMVMGITARRESLLGRSCNLVLALPECIEGGPVAEVPMASTVTTIVLGDALAALVAHRCEFTSSDLAVLHPGGRIGVRLRPVRQVMQAGSRIPLVAPDTPCASVIAVMTDKGFGIAGIVDPATERLVGVITDGDLRRNHGRLDSALAQHLSGGAPITLGPDDTAGQALDLARAHRISALFVVDGDGAPIGLVDLQDLLRVGID
ncbi:MAG: KpsF/GutQ family sugar-phosphate isomerase [Pseudomonadota bacterium]